MSTEMPRHAQPPFDDHVPFHVQLRMLFAAFMRSVSLAGYDIAFLAFTLRLPEWFVDTKRLILTSRNAPPPNDMSRIESQPRIRHRIGPPIPQQIHPLVHPRPTLIPQLDLSRTETAVISTLTVLSLGVALHTLQVRSDYWYWARDWNGDWDWRWDWMEMAVDWAVRAWIWRRVCQVVSTERDPAISSTATATVTATARPKPGGMKAVELVFLLTTLDTVFPPSFHSHPTSIWAHGDAYPGGQVQVRTGSTGIGRIEISGWSDWYGWGRWVGRCLKIALVLYSEVSGRGQSRSRVIDIGGFGRCYCRHKDLDRAAAQPGGKTFGTKSTSRTGGEPKIELAPEISRKSASTRDVGVQTREVEPSTGRPRDLSSSGNKRARLGGRQSTPAWHKASHDLDDDTGEDDADADDNETEHSDGFESDDGPFETANTKSDVPGTGEKQVITGEASDEPETDAIQLPEEKALGIDIAKVGPPDSTRMDKSGPGAGNLEGRDGVESSGGIQSVVLPGHTRSCAMGKQDRVEGEIRFPLEKVAEERPEGCHRRPRSIPAELIEKDNCDFEILERSVEFEPQSLIASKGNSTGRDRCTASLIAPETACGSGRMEGALPDGMAYGEVVVERVRNAQIHGLHTSNDIVDDRAQSRNSIVFPWPAGEQAAGSSKASKGGSDILARKSDQAQVTVEMIFAPVVLAPLAPLRIARRVSNDRPQPLLGNQDRDPIERRPTDESTYKALQRFRSGLAELDPTFTFEARRERDGKLTVNTGHHRRARTIDVRSSTTVRLDELLRVESEFEV